MRKQLLIEAILVGAIAAIFVSPLLATECPPGAKSCKVVTMTGDEMSALDAIFNAAMYANRMQMEPLTNAWKKKISESADGDVKEAKPEEKK